MSIFSGILRRISFYTAARSELTAPEAGVMFRGTADAPSIRVSVVQNGDVILSHLRYGIV